MKRAIDNFAFSIERASETHALHTFLVDQVTPVCSFDDLLRFEIVQAVSALDAFVHEITLLGMLEIIKGVRASTPQFDRFPFSARSVLNFRASGDVNLLADDIVSRHNHISFQHPKKIAEAIRLFSPVELWNRIGDQLERDPNALKNDLIFVVDRRNKLVHEADIMPPYPMQRWPIKAEEVEQAREFVNALGFAIFEVV